MITDQCQQTPTFTIPRQQLSGYLWATELGLLPSRGTCPCRYLRLDYPASTLVSDASLIATLIMAHPPPAQNSPPGYKCIEWQTDDGMQNIYMNTMDKVGDCLSHPILLADFFSFLFFFFSFAFPFPLHFFYPVRGAFFNFRFLISLPLCGRSQMQEAGCAYILPVLLLHAVVPGIPDSFPLRPAAD
jgi:hypothetical protein